MDDWDLRVPWDEPSAGQSWRSWMTTHLHTHPDHHRRFSPGHDFVLVSTIDIAREHERLHRGFFHDHDRAWHVLEKEESMSKSLDLKVTVSGEDPDAALAKMHKPSLQLSSSSSSTVKVTKIERADGLPFGLESEFEKWWAENHCEEDETDGVDKEWAQNAFLYGWSIGKEKA